MPRIPALAALLATLAACGGETPAPAPAAPAAAPAPAASHEGHEGHDMGAAKDAAFAPLPKPAKVFFVSPVDGASVTSPVKLVFGAEGVDIVPAGEPKPQSGHHHVIVDGAGVPAGEGVPKDDTHIHYGGGQTEAELTLTPGEHTLTLQLADWAHRSYGPELTATIKLTVTE